MFVLMIYGIMYIGYFLSENIFVSKCFYFLTVLYYNDKDLRRSRLHTQDRDVHRILHSKDLCTHKHNFLKQI